MAKGALAKLLEWGSENAAESREGSDYLTKLRVVRILGN